MTPAFTTKCLVRTCSPNKHGWRSPVKTVAVATTNVSIRDHETDRGRRSLARQGFRPREVKVSTGDGRLVERLARFTPVGWQLEHKPVAARCRAQWLRLSAAIISHST